MTRCLTVLSALLGLAAPAAAGSYCDVVFKDVARQSPIVLLVEYREPQDGPPMLLVREAIKGVSDRQTLNLGEHGLSLFDPADGDRFLLALTVQHTLVKVVPGLGFCSPISVLKLKGDKLRGKDRGNYDGGRSPITLDQIRGQIYLTGTAK